MVFSIDKSNVLFSAAASMIDESIPDSPAAAAIFRLSYTVYYNHKKV